MAEEELAVRSEKPSLMSLDQAFDALMVTGDSGDLAILLVLINELYADSSCRCEEKAASYGEDSEEVKVCNLNVVETRDKFLSSYRAFVDRLKAELLID